MRHPVPASLGFILFSGIVYLMQLTPFTGVFLMILAGPFWSIVLINLGFLGIAVEAALGLTFRLWLILPVLWFGGYGAWAASERADLAAERAAFEQSNARTAAAIAPAPLLLEDADYYAREALAVALVSSYAAPSVHVTGGDAVAEPTAYRFSNGALCQTGARINHHALRDSAGGLRKACVYSVAEPVPAGAVRVHISRTAIPTPGPVSNRTDLAVTAPDGRRFALATATATPLPWIPRPIMGCALNSNMNSWECMRGFGRQQPRDLLDRQTGEGGLARVLAAGIGLQPRTAQTREDPVSAARAAELTASASQVALDALKQMLAEPENRNLGRSDLVMLKSRPDLVRPYASAMMAAAESQFADETASNRVGALQMLLAELPDADFEPLRPRFARLYRPGAVISSYMTDVAILDRLGLSRRRASPTSNQYRIVPLAEASEYEQRRYRERQAAR